MGIWVNPSFYPYSKRIYYQMQRRKLPMECAKSSFQLICIQKNVQVERNGKKDLQKFKWIGRFQNLQDVGKEDKDVLDIRNRIQDEIIKYVWMSLTEEG